MSAIMGIEELGLLVRLIRAEGEREEGEGEREGGRGEGGRKGGRGRKE